MSRPPWRSPDIVVPDGLQVVVQLIDQRHTSGDLQAGDVLVRDVVKVLHLQGANRSSVSRGQMLVVLNWSLVLTFRGRGLAVC